MIADLHAHYAMHLVDEGASVWKLLGPARGRGSLRDRARALLVGLASRFGNYRSLFSGPRVTLSSLREGDVRVVLSVLYSFFDELELDEPYPAQPKRAYRDSLIGQLELVEHDLAEKHGSTAVVVRTPDAARAGARGRSGGVRSLRGGRLPPRLDPGGGGRGGEDAGRARRGLHHARPSRVAPRGHQHQRPALPVRARLPALVSSTGERGTLGSRPDRREGDAQRGGADRSVAHERPLAERHPRPARRGRPGQDPAGDRVARVLSLRVAGVRRGRADAAARCRARRRGRPDPGPAPVARRRVEHRRRSRRVIRGHLPARGPDLGDHGIGRARGDRLRLRRLHQADDGGVAIDVRPGEARGAAARSVRRGRRPP